MPEEGLRHEKGGGGAEETAIYGLAYSVDSYVVDVLLVEGSVDLGRDVHDIGCEERDRLVEFGLEAPLVDDRRGGQLLFGAGLVALLERTMVHPPWLGAAATAAYVFPWVEVGEVVVELKHRGWGWGAEEMCPTWVPLQFF